MQLLTLAEQDGLRPKKVAATKGGEFHSPCPGCGGEDRFIIWDKTNRYFCRQCEKRGDVIQYLRDFHSLSYRDACLRLNVSPKARKSSHWQRQFDIRRKFEPKVADMPPAPWRDSASSFVKFCQDQLEKDTAALDSLFQRGFSLESIKHFQLGWNPQTVWVHRDLWGLSNAEKKKIWIPQGLLIPTLDLTTQEVIKLKIRRNKWHSEDELPKYVEIAGSMQSPGVYGDPSDKPIIVLESEFDALLIQQFVSDLCCSIAVGGATKRPDQACHRLLVKAPLILFAFDTDDAGAIAYRWWGKIYPNLRIWLPPKGKSPGDAFKEGIDLRKWIEIGLEEAKAAHKKII